MPSPESASEGRRWRSHPAWKGLAAIVTIASSAWVIWLFSGAWSTLVDRRAQIGIVPLAAGMLLAMLSSYLIFEAFATLTRARRVSSLPKRQLAHLYFTAQLLKHLPGRVWGLGYQWAGAQSNSRLVDWVLINLAHVLMSTYFALWGAFVVLGLSAAQKWGALTGAIGVVGYFGGWRVVSSETFIRFAGKLPGAVGRFVRKVCTAFAEMPASDRLRLFAFFCSGWMLYYFSWLLNGLSYPALGALDGMQLCAYYMLAWFVGYISLLTPSGLGVRELAFAWLAKDFPADAVALMAIVGRASLLAVDLVMGLIFAPFAPRRN